jgi:protein O-GlcNAc transferase
MGTRLKASGDAAGAQTYYEEAVRADPSLFAPRYNLGTLYLEAGDLLWAREHMEQAHMLDPQSADTMSNLGAIHQTQGNLEIAVQWYKAAVAINPMGPAVQNLSNALVTLGQQLRPQGHKLAIKKYQEALTHWHGNAMAYFNLGLTYASLNKNEKALINYQLAAHFNPRFAEAHNNMGVIHKQLGNVQRAIDCYHLALQCNPNFAQALNNAGMACTAIGRLQEALGYLTRCVAVAPNYSDAYNNLGWLFWDQGDLAQALHMYEKCVELAPSSDKPAQNRLLALNYLPDADAGLIYQAHALWAERHCRETGAAISEWSVARTAQRRLKIAYMSPDLFHHSVSFFAHALLEHRNRELFDLHIYSNGTREDEKTAIFKQLVGPDRWFSIVGKSASEAAEMIRNDQIDILIDLAGHTANNRLDVTAMKPAPVVMTYIGYNNTTGLGAVDYRITDAVVDPVDTRQQHSEELVRLPGCFLCYTPPTKIPDVGPLPAARNGTVTFGSFSCLAKVHPGVVALWSKVLRAVPGSKLVIKAKGFYSPEVQLRISSMFERHGIAANRLRLVSLTNGPFEHLNMYNEVDIALDTFPYANTTTTCETLLMGVPVVTLAGKTHGSRVGVTLLHQVGLDDLVAEDQDAFVRNATALANDLGRLAVIRAQLRPSLLGSPMCDGPGFMREKFEPMLLEKWRLLCEGRLPSVQTFTSEALPHPLAPGPFAAPMPRRGNSSGHSGR